MLPPPPFLASYGFKLLIWLTAIVKNIVIQLSGNACNHLPQVHSGVQMFDEDRMRRGYICHARVRILSPHGEVNMEQHIYLCGGSIPPIAIRDIQYRIL